MFIAISLPSLMLLRNAKILSLQQAGKSSKFLNLPPRIVGFDLLLPDLSMPFEFDV